MTTTSPNPYEPSREPVLAALAPAGSGLMRDGETLSVAYEVGVEDLVALNLHHYSRSPLSRRAYYRAWFSVPFAILVLVVSLWVIQGGGDLEVLALYLFVALIPVGVYLVYYPMRYPALIRRNTRRVYAEGRNAAMYGVWRVVIAPQRLSVLMPLVESRYQWAALERVERSENAIYLYVGAASAVFIPARAFNNVQEMDEVERVLRARMTT
jgi:hypothetical protein